MERYILLPMFFAVVLFFSSVSLALSNNGFKVFRLHFVKQRAER